MNKTNIATMFGATDVSTFLGLPSCASPDQVNAKAAILGVPCATPYASVGPYCAGGPAAIRAAAAPYAANLEHMDFDFAAPLLPGGRQDACDLGDLGYGEDSASNRAAIKTAVSAVVDRGAVPIVLGGDDSIPIPMLQAFAGHGTVHILQIDAHIDWRDEVEGTRWGLSSTMRRASEMAHIGKIIQVGARGVGSAGITEVEAAQAYGAHLYPANRLHEAGIGPVLDLVPQGEPVIVCFDCDALDPSIMPAVIAPTGAGITHAHQSP